jgi:hypothetical protein
MRVAFDDLERFCWFTRVPKFEQAVIPAGDDVVKLVWIVVEIPYGLAMRLWNRHRFSAIVTIRSMHVNENNT